MATRFQVGQRVRSTVNAQGLTAGQEYEVTGVERFGGGGLGGYTTYVLGGALRVVNGHLLLQLVSR